MDTPSPNKSWQDLVSRANAEAPPAIDVRFPLRQQIESELSRKTSQPAAPGLLDEIAALVQYRWSLATAAATVLLAWQFYPAIREVAIALQFQSQLLAGL
jgi:hypothetical protein